VPARLAVLAAAASGSAAARAVAAAPAFCLCVSCTIVERVLTALARLLVLPLQNIPNIGTSYAQLRLLLLCTSVTAAFSVGCCSCCCALLLLLLPWPRAGPPTPSDT